VYAAELRASEVVVGVSNGDFPTSVTATPMTNPARTC
jgi:hypothetical protein